MQPTEPVKGSEPDFPKPSQEIWKSIKKFALIILISTTLFLSIKNCIGCIVTLDANEQAASIERAARYEKLKEKLAKDEAKWFEACFNDGKKSYECKALWAAAGGREGMAKVQQ